MRSFKIRLASGVLSAIMLVSTIGLASTSASASMLSENKPVDICDVSIPVDYAMPKVDKKKISDFVTRLYKVCLGRKPDKAGLDAWVSELTGRRQTGVSTAYGFIFSPEFQNKKCSNTEYVQYMYNAFFGRKADPAGLKTWVDMLDSGVSREKVFAGFANSAEFDNLCAQYGVLRGDYFEGFDWVKTAQVNLFVDRLYLSILERSCDAAGMSNWTYLLLTKQMTGAEVAAGFVFSKEFKDRNLCDDCYVKVLYEAFMGRSADSAGFKTWTSALKRGETREYAFNGFVGSQEFTNICSDYGINRGSANVQGNTHAMSGNCSSCKKVITPPTGGGSAGGSTGGSTGGTKPTSTPSNGGTTGGTKPTSVPSSGINLPNGGKVSVIGHTTDFEVYTKYSSVKYDFRTIGYEGFNKEVSRILASGDGAPDLIYMDFEVFTYFKENSAIIPISSLGITSSEISDMFPYTIEKAKDNRGAVKNLSILTCPGGVFYNRTVAQKMLGVSSPSQVAPYFDEWKDIVNLSSYSTDDYKVVYGMEEYSRSFLSQRKTAWITNGCLSEPQLFKDLFSMSKLVNDYDGTWNGSQWAPDWTGCAKNNTVLSYWGPMWMASALYLNNPEENPTSGDWGFVPSPTPWIWGGSVLCVTKYCDSGNDTAQLVRDTCLNKTNVKKWCKDCNYMVVPNSKSVTKELANSSSCNLSWLGGQNPYSYLYDIGMNANTTYDNIYESEMLGYVNQTLDSIDRGEYYLESSYYNQFANNLRNDGYIR